MRYHIFPHLLLVNCLFLTLNATGCYQAKQREKFETKPDDTDTDTLNLNLGRFSTDSTSGTLSPPTDQATVSTDTAPVASTASDGTVADSDSSSQGDTAPPTENYTDDVPPLDDTATPANELFGQQRPIEYHITMSDEDHEHIEEYGDDEEYRPASLRVVADNIDISFEEVGFRHKGAWTLHHCFETGERSYDDECAKLSYKIKFNEYINETRLFGLKRLNLHAMSGEGSKLRERLAYNMFREFGVVAPRTAYGELFINGTYSGLFISVEQIDGRFTAFNFPHDKDGNLYKEIWPKTGVDDEHYLSHLKTNNNPEDNPDVSDMHAFAETVDAATQETFRQDIEPWLNLDNIYRYIAVDRASKNWDGFVTFYSRYTSHNFYWYHESETDGIFHLIPWDLDNTFWEFDPFMAPEQWVDAEAIPNWNVLPYSCDPLPVWEENGDTRVVPPGCDKLINLWAATGWDHFVSVGNALLSGPLNTDVMNEKLTIWSSTIEEAVQQDPLIDYDDWLDEVEALREDLDRAVVDFTDHLSEGYIIEEPEEVIPEPDDVTLNAGIEERGLVVDTVNNYEFVDGAEEEAPVDTFSYGDDNAIESAMWNTEDPLSGEADLRYNFEFHRVEGAWNEWAGVGVATEAWSPIDINGFSEISITMKADKDRDVRIRVLSPVYEETFGDVQSEFGQDFVVTETPAVYKLELDRLYYPDWAKDDWDDDQGWSTSDMDALGLVLTEFNGLVFSPTATRDSEGEMIDEEDVGFLQIDNIYFR